MTGRRLRWSRQPICSRPFECVHTSVLLCYACASPGWNDNTFTQTNVMLACRAIIISHSVMTAAVGLFFDGLQSSIMEVFGDAGWASCASVLAGG